jgi:hypothetical protein
MEFVVAQVKMKPTLTNKKVPHQMKSLILRPLRCAVVSSRYVSVISSLGSSRSVSVNRGSIVANNGSGRSLWSCTRPVFELQSMELCGTCSTVWTTKRSLALVASVVMSNSDGLIYSEEEVDGMKKTVLEAFREGPNAVEELLQRWDFTKSPFSILALWLAAADKVNYPLLPHLPKISRALEKGSFPELDDSDVANAFYGMRNLDARHPDVRKLLSELTYTISSCEGELELEAVIRCVVGLKNFTGEQIEARRALKVFASQLSDCDDKCSSSEIGYIVYGLRGMSSAYSEVRAMISEVTHLARGSIGAYDAEALRSIFHAMKNWDCEHSEVQEFFECITNKLSHVSKPLTGGAISSMMHLFGHVRCDDHTVKNLLLATLKLLKKQSRTSLIMTENELSGTIQSIRGVQYDEKAGLMLAEMLDMICSVNSHNRVPMPVIAFAINSLSALSSYHSEVPGLVSALTPYLVTCPQSPSAEEVSAMMNGLSNLNIEHSGVGQLLSAIIAKASGCMDKFTGSQIAQCVYGFHSMNSDSREVLNALSALSDKFAKSISPMTSITSLEVASTFEGLWRMNAQVAEVRAMLTCLHRLMLQCSNPRRQDLDLAIEIVCLLDENVPEVKAILKQLKHLYSIASR